MPLPDRVRRIAAIDGLRGLLAMVVVVDHACTECGVDALGGAADIAVVLFFTMSGYVLTRGWDGRFAAFLVRRVLRLWPVFALAMAGGYLLARRAPEPLEFVWIPLPRYDANEICPPAWSLFIEAWAALAMPAIAWSAKGGWPRSLACIAGCLALDVVWVPGNLAVRAAECYLVCFVAGAAGSGRTLHSPLLERALPQFLGRISYSLYMTHWLVLHFAAGMLGRAGVAIGLPCAVLIAWGVYRAVERPSVRFSRLVSADRAAAAGS